MDKMSLIVIAVLIIAWVITHFIRKDLRLKTLEYIGKAEVINKDVLYKAIDGFQKSDLDDRMVYVIVSLMRTVPIIRIIPHKVLFNMLNGYAQSTFNHVKALLKTKTQAREVITEVTTELKPFTGEESEVIEKAINAKFDELQNIISSQLEKITSAVESNAGKVEEILKNEHKE